MRFNHTKHLSRILQNWKVNIFSPFKVFINSGPFRRMVNLDFRVVLTQPRPYQKIIMYVESCHNTDRWSRTPRISNHACWHTWGMMVSLDRSSCRPSVATSTPSIMILPSTDSMIRNNDKAREDLPAPVRPTTPTYRAMIYCEPHPSTGQWYTVNQTHQQDSDILWTTPTNRAWMYCELDPPTGQWYTVNHTHPQDNDILWTRPTYRAMIHCEPDDLQGNHILWTTSTYWTMI